MGEQIRAADWASNRIEELRRLGRDRNAYPIAVREASRRFRIPESEIKSALNMRRNPPRIEPESKPEPAIEIEPEEEPEQESHGLLFELDPEEESNPDLPWR